MKFIRVNMTTKEIATEQVSEAYMGLGGRGLTSVMINSEVPATCDALGPENKLIFAPGILSGTKLVNTGRLSIGAKSPLTGTIKESNAGGNAAVAFSRLGITALIVEGRAETNNSIIVVDVDGNARFESADEFMGMRTYALTKALLDKFGSDNAVLSIGPAGEQQLLTASVQASDVDGRPCRSAARGGLGAVMGAKGVKAVVISSKGNSLDAIADPEAFSAASKAFVAAIKAQPFCNELLPALGTAALMGPINGMGAFPCYNATKGQMEGWEKISGETIAETITQRGGVTDHRGCSGCIIRCSNEYVDSSGKYVTSSLEYESIWALGGMTGITDIDVIARLDYLCDDIGVDTMSTGVAVAVAMDAGYKEFGDGEAALGILEEIAQGTEMGTIFGNGPDAVGRHFQHTRVPTVKGQSIAAYDPRGMQGNGVTYATSPMGADHTAGNVLGEYMNQVLDPLKPEGQVAASFNTQVAIAAVDCTGLCIFAGFALQDPAGGKAFLDAMNAKLGLALTPDDIPAMGIRVLQAERAFNKKAGFTNQDDRLPDFFKKEPLPPHQVVFEVADHELDQTFQPINES